METKKMVMDTKKENNKKTEEERLKELKASPIYRLYRDRQNAMARDRRKARKNDNG